MKPKEQQKRILKIRKLAVELGDELKELDEGDISGWQDVIKYLYEKKEGK